MTKIITNSQSQVCTFLEIRQILDDTYLFEKFLQKNALWVIMDPWYPTPYKKDVENCPNIDQHNQKTIDKILNYLPNLKLDHVCISCPKYLQDENENDILDLPVSVNPQLTNFYNIENDLLKLCKLMMKKSLSIIVYCGFHYGNCIVFKPDGVETTSRLFKTFVKKDLCCLFPNELTWEEADNITKKYAEII
jgi:hypothetical protein